MAIKEELEALRDKVKANLKEIKNKIELTNEKANVLGKKGPFAQIMANMRNLTVEERKEIGMISNQYRLSFQKHLMQSLQSLMMQKSMLVF